MFLAVVQVEALITVDLTDGKTIKVRTVCIAYTPNRDPVRLVIVEAFPHHQPDEWEEFKVRRARMARARRYVQACD